MVLKPDLFNTFFHKFLSLSYFKDNIIGFYSIYPFKPIISDFYLTNSYTKYSLNMITSSEIKKRSNNIFLSLSSN